MRRALVVLWLVLSSSAFAHLEAVRVEAIFPTASRSGVQLHLLGSSSGFPVTGAKLELEIHGPDGKNERQSFIEGPPGTYKIDRGFQEGAYTFKVIDSTFDYESLEREITASLPRPKDQDVQIWDWPATPPPGAQRASQGFPVLLAVLGGIPLVIVVIGVGILLLARRKVATPDS